MSQKPRIIPLLYGQKSASRKDFDLPFQHPEKIPSSFVLMQSKTQRHGARGFCCDPEQEQHLNLYCTDPAHRNHWEQVSIPSDTSICLSSLISKTEDWGLSCICFQSQSPRSDIAAQDHHVQECCPGHCSGNVATLQPGSWLYKQAIDPYKDLVSTSH